MRRQILLRQLLQKHSMNSAQLLVEPVEIKGIARAECQRLPVASRKILRTKGDSHLRFRRRVILKRRRKPVSAANQRTNRINLTEAIFKKTAGSCRLIKCRFGSTFRPQLVQNRTKLNGPDRQISAAVRTSRPTDNLPSMNRQETCRNAVHLLPQKPILLNGR